MSGNVRGPCNDYSSSPPADAARAIVEGLIQGIQIPLKALHLLPLFGEGFGQISACTFKALICFYFFLRMRTTNDETGIHHITFALLLAPKHSRTNDIGQ